MRGGLLALVIWTAAVCGARAQTPPPLDAYGRLPAIEHVTVSPVGDRVAYIGQQGAQRKLFVVDGADKTLLVVDTGVAKVRGLQWAGNDRIIVKVTSTVALDFYADDPSEVSSIAVFNIPAHKGMVVFAGHTNMVQAVFADDGVAQINGRWYGFYGGYPFNPSRTIRGRYPFLMRVDLDTGDVGVVAISGDQFRTWLVSPAGDLIAHKDYDDPTGNWSIVAGPFEGGKVLASGKGAFGGATIMGQGRVPGSVLISTDDRSAGVLEELSPTGGAPMVEPDKASIARTIFDLKTGAWIGTTKEGDDHEARFFDPALQAKIDQAIAVLPADNAKLVSASDDFNHLTAFTDTNGDSGTYWLVDAQARTAKAIGRAYPDVAPSQTGSVSMVAWTAADGTPLHGVLTLPPGSAGRNLPVVVLPHGGPEARDYPRFDWWAQAFAGRGYAVFQPNFRGSSGYGVAFRNAGFGEWGRKMQTDVSDGVTALAARGVIDPKRACIVGGSYGGYAALAGVTVQHGLYRCAAAYGGVSDPAGMIAYAVGNTQHEGADTRYWRTFMGAASNNDTKLNAISPLANAGRADAPILLIHGRSDSVVPFHQSDVMQRALQQSGKSVEMVALPGEDHWLSREITRTQMLKAMVTFVEKYNPPQS
jgi:dipeptidyl aminopeptidase/acylaminoacyl peptidase